MARMPMEDQEDLLADVVQDLQADDFRRLRTYSNQGKPFAAWFWQVLRRRALDRLKADKVRAHGEIPLGATDRAPLPLDEAGSRAALEDVREVIRALSPRCQVLLLATAEGYKAKDLLDLDCLPYTDNKKLADHLKNCRRSLVKALRKRGYEVDDVVG
jgi:RNA polymerase sigma factor (sigma-70 family)